MSSEVIATDPAANNSASTSNSFGLGGPPDEVPHIEPAPPTRLNNVAGVEIVKIDFNNAKDRAKFLDVADPIYEGDPNYIALLRMHYMKFLHPQKNPAFRNIKWCAFIAYKDKKAVARITAQVDANYNSFNQSNTGFFGFFECINDRGIAHAILNKALDWLKEEGVSEVFGPMNFNSNHQLGLLIENFDSPPYVEETYNPTYYEELLTSYGFGKAKDLYAWSIDIREGMETKNRQRIVKIAERVKKRENITIRPVNMKDAKNEMKRIYDIYVSAWEKNWAFSPLDWTEFEWLASDFKMVAVADLVLIVEANGKPVGFSFTLPNLNENMPKNGRIFPFNWLKMLKLKKTKTARLITLGMIPEYRKRGLETLMFAETLLRAKKLGIVAGEVGWTLEDNDLINKSIQMMDAELYRKYRILGMKLS